MIDIFLPTETVQDDRDGDNCACAPRLETVPKQITLNRQHRYIRCDLLKVIPIDSQFQLIAHMEGGTRIALVGQSTKRVLDVFAQPLTITQARQYLDDLPSDTVRVFARR